MSCSWLHCKTQSQNHKTDKTSLCFAGSLWKTERLGQEESRGCNKVCGGSGFIGAELSVSLNGKLDSNALWGPETFSLISVSHINNHLLINILKFLFWN